MSDNVVYWNGVTRLDIPADRVLECNLGLFESVVLIGYDKEGHEYFVSSIADGGDVLWLIERLKARLISDQ